MTKKKVRWICEESDVPWQAANRFGPIEVAILWTGEGKDYRYAAWDHRINEQVAEGVLHANWDYSAATRRNEERIIKEIHDSLFRFPSES